MLLALDVVVPFSGSFLHSLPSYAGEDSLDTSLVARSTYTMSLQNTWHSVDVAGEQPAKRSVHALVGLRGALRSDGIVALMLFGEGEASDLGHAGAGKFHDDAWALVKAPLTELTEGWSWEKLIIPEGSSKPQARGWFAADAWLDGKVVFQGGLNTDNERLSDAWILEVEKVNMIRVLIPVKKCTCTLLFILLPNDSVNPLYVDDMSAAFAYIDTVKKSSEENDDPRHEACPTKLLRIR